VWAPSNHRSLLQNIVFFIGLFCKRDCNFKEPTNRSHPTSCFFFGNARVASWFMQYFECVALWGLCVCVCVCMRAMMLHTSTLKVVQACDTCVLWYICLAQVCVTYVWRAPLTRVMWLIRVCDMMWLFRMGNPPDTTYSCIQHIYVYNIFPRTAHFLILHIRMGNPPSTTYLCM